MSNNDFTKALKIECFCSAEEALETLSGCEKKSCLVRS